MSSVAISDFPKISICLSSCSRRLVDIALVVDRTVVGFDDRYRGVFVKIEGTASFCEYRLTSGLSSRDFLLCALLSR